MRHISQSINYFHMHVYKFFAMNVLKYLKGNDTYSEALLYSYLPSHQHFHNEFYLRIILSFLKIYCARNLSPNSAISTLNSMWKCPLLTRPLCYCQASSMQSSVPQQCCQYSFNKPRAILFHTHIG